jgi:hypothetical protein
MLRIDEHHDRLAEKVKTFSALAVDNRQVAARLRDLLPRRFFEIKSKHYAYTKHAGRAERMAFTDPAYLKFIEEFVEVNSEAVHARVQFETHLMLIDARKSLRAFNRKR